MKDWRAYWNEETQRYPAAIVIGLLWALAYPLPGVAGLAWVVPGCFWLLTAGLSGRRAFRAGCVIGAVHFLVSLRWLLAIPHPAGALAGWLALSAYCAIYPALWAWTAGQLTKYFSSGGAPSNLGMSSRGWLRDLEPVAHWPWWWRAQLWLTLAAVWVALEMLRARLFSGFAWNYLGVTQWRQISLLQITSFTGVYGLSFLVCWLSLSLSGAFLVITFRPRDRWGWTAETRLPLLVLLLVASSGFWAVLGYRRDLARAPGSLRLALIQPAVPQTLQWDAAADRTNFATLFALSEPALALKPDVLVWPEGSFGLDTHSWPQITNAIGLAGVEWIFNETAFDDSNRPLNSAMLVNAAGRLVERYDKRRLVPFGEYIPLERWIPFLRYLTPIGSSFASGAGPVAFHLGGSGIRPSRELPGQAMQAEAAPIICFEDTFPHGVREQVTASTDFLLELTNDAWFGESSAQWQHAANAVFRAVENGVPLVRCANNGLSLWFDASGVPHDFYGEGRNVYQAGFELAEVPVGLMRRPTFYRQRGDVFGWTCVGWTVLCLVRTHCVKRSQHPFAVCCPSGTLNLNERSDLENSIVGVFLRSRTRNRDRADPCQPTIQLPEQRA